GGAVGCQTDAILALRVLLGELGVLGEKPGSTGRRGPRGGGSSGILTTDHGPLTPDDSRPSGYNGDGGRGGERGRALAARAWTRTIRGFSLPSLHRRIASRLRFREYLRTFRSGSRTTASSPTEPSTT